MGILDQTQEQYYNESSNFGNYQFTSLDDVINQFMVVYVGEGKIISKASRMDVQFHAMRALAELSFDTFKSIKSQEITVPPSLTMILPQDYVNYTKISSVDGSGIKHPLYPTLGKTSNPTPILQNSDGDYFLTAIGTLDENSQLVVLDKEYKNILVGMKVTGPSIPSTAWVASVTNSGGITTIGLADPYQGNAVIPDNLNDIKDGTAVEPTYTGTETLTFKMFSEPWYSDNGPVSGNILIEQGDAFILEGVTFDDNTDPEKITAASTSDAAKISVGMYVSHTHFTPGTKVTDVNGAVITVDTPALADSTTTNSTHGSSNEITFVSIPADSETWSNYKSNKPSENTQHDYDYDDHVFEANVGRRYGIEPSHAQDNGSYYIDDLKGLIHFSSNISGKTVVLDYISDSLGTDGEMQVHKFAEEAMYKSIVYAILSTKANIPEYIVRRYKKERFAEIRKAKLRLSNIKLEEITQVFRGKSKHIKH
jgi:hypothetical protein